ncbi:putative ATP-grasp-modified RiPP [Streptomyces sp. MH13]|uniref:putative ATP-grasp-modified RiPP n=1 Tax=Streptomyces sp. MH13 TaxID=3417651 RepID=UPI003CE88632
MLTQEVLDRAIAEWLVGSDPSPERARREWTAQGVALLPLGERFAAVRMPAHVVHAAVRTQDRDRVAVALGELLGGSIICDRRVAGGTYYALIQGHAALVWAYDEIATCLGSGTYLGIPRIDRQQPPGTYWVVPPRYEGDLCAPRAITALVSSGRARLTEQAATSVSLPSTNRSEQMRLPTFHVPWAMRLVTDRLPAGPSPYAHVDLDPVTQTARYTDTAGQVVEMGRHGTSRTSGTVSVSGGGDGQQPQPQSQDDTTTDYESD